jgi:hypothetical protein
MLTTPRMWKKAIVWHNTSKKTGGEEYGAKAYEFNKRNCPADTAGRK